jgi:hypothetical protein
MLAAGANEDNDGAKCGGRARWMRRRLDEAAAGGWDDVSKLDVTPLPATPQF